MSDETRIPDFEQPDELERATPPAGGLEEVLEVVRETAPEPTPEPEPEPEPTPEPPRRRTTKTIRPQAPKVVAAKCPVCGFKAGAQKAGERALCKNCSQEVELQPVTE